MPKIDPKLLSRTAMGLGLGGLYEALQPNNAEAGPRADAIRKALQGPLFHGTKKGAAIAQDGYTFNRDMPGIYLSDVPKVANDYAGGSAHEALQLAPTVMMEKLASDAKTRVYRGKFNDRQDSIGYMRPNVVKDLRDQGYDAATIMPRKNQPWDYHDNAVESAFKNAEIAVLNPDKLKPWLAGGGSIASLLAMSQDSEAMPMPKDVRAAYNAARKALRDAGKDDKPLYTWSRELEEFMTNPKVPVDRAEEWKPPAIYASDNLGDNLLSRVGEYGTFDQLKSELRSQRGSSEGYARIVPKPTAKRASQTESDAINEYEQALEYGSPIDSTHFPASDILKMLDVDGNPGLSEYLIRNPNAVQIFSDKGMWPKTGVAAGSIAGLLGMSQDAEAMPLGPWSKASKKAVAKSLATSTRTEDAFYRMLGHRFHTNTDNPKEVVDVVRSKNGRDFHIVTKGADGERYVLPMTKDYLEALSAAKGTQGQLETLKTLSPREKDLQVMKSATMRENKKASQLAPITNTDYRGWTAGGKRMVEEMDPDLVHDYVHVYNEADELIYMPKAYADILVKRGMYTFSPKNKHRRR